MESTISSQASTAQSDDFVERPLSSMTDAERDAYYAKVMRDVTATRLRIDDQLKKSQVVREQVAECLKQSKEVDDRYEKFKQDFSDVLGKICEGIKGDFTPPSFTHKPIETNAKEAAKYLKDCKNIMILTGAGLSAASGIPTFRGANGFWTKSYENHTDPMEILTMKTFETNPSVVWSWHWDFLDLMKKCKPNKGHLAISNFQQFCQKSENTKCLLVTQNIDNYHAELIQQADKKAKTSKEGTEDFAFTKDVLEIHGNLLYMHCSDEQCSKTFYNCPESPKTEELRKTFVPKCAKCEKPMKPHCMFFDETYSEQWYKSETVRTYLENKMDGLIVIGTALQTSLAKTIVNRTLNQFETPVIEVNLNPEVINGYGIIVKEKSEVALPILLQEIINLKSKKKY